eukprot:1604631-Rhodomonas_salina.1
MRRACYALATRYPLLTEGLLLPGAPYAEGQVSYATSLRARDVIAGTDMACCATSYNTELPTPRDRLLSRCILCYAFAMRRPELTKVTDHMSAVRCLALTKILFYAFPVRCPALTQIVRPGRRPWIWVRSTRRRGWNPRTKTRP